MNTDTIAAVATAPGRGGVGIVRVSGPKSAEIAAKILHHLPKPRLATFTGFYSLGNELLDQGLALFFPGPNSFTGEDVLELQGHGGPVILDLLLSEVIKAGARLARPGEFSERAFLNDKLDLAQAEAIADLIDASTTHAAKQAVNSLKGDFSTKIDDLVAQLIHLRMYVESAIDFPEEEIDFLSDGKVSSDLHGLIQQISLILHTAQQGALIKEGMRVVIAGRPNAGKSSLLNALAGRDVAIVTDIAGTTRDVLREHINIDGMPLHIIDTAGLRESPDKVEKMGIERAWKEIEDADRILLVIDTADSDQMPVQSHWKELLENEFTRGKLTVLYNKIDETGVKLGETHDNVIELAISAKSGQGLEALRQHLKQVMGFEGTTEGGFSARRRHIVAIETAQRYLLTGKQQLEEYGAGELLADDLQQAQNALSEITGKFTSDDLLGKIFSSFCIGK